MLDVVFDTNVIIAALRSRDGASFALIEMAGETDLFRLNLSVPLVLEYEAVAIRDSDRSGLEQSDINDVIDYLCSIALAHPIFYLWRPRLRDPSDEFILELAVKSECQYIVTFNTRDFAGVEDFGIQLATPGEFLQLIRKHTT